MIKNHEKIASGRITIEKGLPSIRLTVRLKLKCLSIARGLLDMLRISATSATIGTLVASGFQTL